MSLACGRVKRRVQRFGVGWRLLCIHPTRARRFVTMESVTAPTLRTILGLDLCARDTIGVCRPWWPPWPGRPVTHMRLCATGGSVPSAHDMHKGKGIRGKRWERRRDLDRQAERRAKSSQVTHCLQWCCFSQRGWYGYSYRGGGNGPTQ